MREEEGCAHITGKSFIVLHQLLILLVDRQHFADSVGRRLSLDGEEREREHETTNTHPDAFRLTKIQLEVPRQTLKLLRFQGSFCLIISLLAFQYLNIMFKFNSQICLNINVHN